MKSILYIHIIFLLIVLRFTNCGIVEEEEHPSIVFINVQGVVLDTLYNMPVDSAGVELYTYGWSGSVPTRTSFAYTYTNSDGNYVLKDTIKWEEACQALGSIGLMAYKFGCYGGVLKRVECSNQLQTVDFLVACEEDTVN